MKPTILPPLVVHDGSQKALQLIEIICAIAAPNMEVIDASTEAGLKRIEEINRGFANGTLDTDMPIMALGTDTAKLRELMKRGYHDTH